MYDFNGIFFGGVTVKKSIFVFILKDRQLFYFFSLSNYNGFNATMQKSNETSMNVIKFDAPYFYFCEYRGA